MLGRTVGDSDGHEGAAGASEGLGLLDVTTELGPTKELRIESATHVASGESISGYHMHMGVTTGPDRDRPFARIGQNGEGAVSKDGLVAGTYLHGTFGSNAFRHSFLKISSDVDHDAVVEAALDGLARHLEQHLDLDALLALAAEVS